MQSSWAEWILKPSRQKQQQSIGQYEQKSRLHNSKDKLKCKYSRRESLQRQQHGWRLKFFPVFLFFIFFFFLFLRKSTKPPCTRLVWTYNNTECTFNQNLYKITNLSRVVFLTTSKTAVELYCNLSCNKKIAIPQENLHPSVKKITSSSIWWFSNSSCFSNSKCHQGSVSR